MLLLIGLQSLPTSFQSAYEVANLFFREVFRLHGLPRSIVSYMDSKFKIHFWQELFRLYRTKLTPSTSYHPQTQIVNKWVEGYLINHIAGKHKAWVKWIYLCEYCYNSTYHMSIQMSPFMALYGYETPSFMDLLLLDNRVLSVGDLLQESQDIVKTLKDNITKLLNQQNQYVDQKSTEQTFEVGDIIYLMSQPYRHSISRRVVSKNISHLIMGLLGLSQQLERCLMTWIYFKRVESIIFFMCLISKRYQNTRLFLLQCFHPWMMRGNYFQYQRLSLSSRRGI